MIVFHKFSDVNPPEDTEIVLVNLEGGGHLPQFYESVAQTETGLFFFSNDERVFSEIELEIDKCVWCLACEITKEALCN